MKLEEIFIISEEMVTEAERDIASHICDEGSDYFEKIMDKLFSKK